MLRRPTCQLHGKYEKGSVCPKCARDVRTAGTRNGVSRAPHECPQHPGYTVRGGFCTSPDHSY